MLHSGQVKIARASTRFNVVRCGRRFGKTTMGVAVVFLGNPKEPKGLRDGYDCGWFAPTYKLLDEAWRSACRFLAPMTVSANSQIHRIELENGAALDFWTLGAEDSGRGRKYGTVIVDEAAMSRGLEPAWHDAIRPTLTDYKGGAWFLSTPKGFNFFHTLHHRGEGRDPEWSTHHAPTTDNPFIDSSEVEAARRMLPERSFRQEYLAEFIADGAGVFRCIDLAPECEWLDVAAPDRGYVIGVDWGRHNDFTVAIVMDGRGHVVHMDRFTDIGYAVQVGRLKAMWERFRCCPVIAESNSMGGPLVEQLQHEGINVQAFQTTAASKTEAIESLVLAFEQGKIALPRDERIDILRSELVAYDQDRLSSGAIRYGAPPGHHDDCVMALAIAWHGIAHTSRIEFSSAGRRSAIGFADAAPALTNTGWGSVSGGNYLSGW